MEPSYWWLRCLKLQVLLLFSLDPGIFSCSCYYTSETLASQLISFFFWGPEKLERKLPRTKPKTLCRRNMGRERNGKDVTFTRGWARGIIRKSIHSQGSSGPSFFPVKMVLGPICSFICCQKPNGFWALLSSFPGIFLLFGGR